MTKAEQVRRAVQELNATRRLLSVRDAEWRIEFQEAPNPFVAVERYFSFAQRIRRAQVIVPYLDAQAEYLRLTGHLRSVRS